MATKSEMNLSKSVQPHFTAAFTAEGGGFEPPRHIAAPSALATRRDQPLCQPSGSAVVGAVKEGEGFEPPGLESPPVFETGALPVQPTLRRSEPSLLDELLLMIQHLPLACSPVHLFHASKARIAAGGIRTHTQTVLETAASAVGLPRPEFKVL